MLHMPGVNLTGFLIPGANGLPDLVVNSTDPADWVQMQIAARQPISDSDVPVVAEAAAAATESSMPDWLKKIEDVLIKRLGISFGDYLRGGKIALFGVVIAVLLIIIGVKTFSAGE